MEVPAKITYSLFWRIFSCPVFKPGDGIRNRSKIMDFGGRFACAE